MTESRLANQAQYFPAQFLFPFSLCKHAHLTFKGKKNEVKDGEQKKGEGKRRKEGKFKCKILGLWCG